MNDSSNKSENEDHRKTVGEWLELPFEWRIPVYQRHYAWDATLESGPIHLFWETVKEQTLERLKGETPPSHYLGAVLVDYKTPRNASDGIMRYDVVDGQQRLTTIQIALLALIRVAKEHGCGIKMQNFLEKYVFLDKARKEPRLFPTNFDRGQFGEILSCAYGVVLNFGGQNVSRETANESKIVETHTFFKKASNELVSANTTHDRKEEKVINAIMQTLLKGFDLVRIVLRKSDDAQRIFESLNNFAKPLTAFDLIRNNVFHRAGPNKDVEMFEKDEWQQLEHPYWEEKADNRRKDPATHIEAYIARTLVAKMQKSFNFDRNNIFKTYKEFSRKFSQKHLSIDKEIESLAAYAEVYQYLDAHIEKDPMVDGLNFGIFRHNVWGNRDFYPVIFSIVGSSVAKMEKQRMLRLLESYVIRRFVCKLSGRNYNKQVPAICKELGNEPSYKSLYEILTRATKVTTVFPKDERVREDAVGVKFYSTAFQRYALEKYVLRRIAYHSESGDETEIKKELTIDHILPQGWAKNPEWEKIVFGEDGARDEAKMSMVNFYLHTIGNLTIMSGKNNSIKANHSFTEVRELLANSALKINRDLAKENEWNVEKIAARSRNLAEQICQIWPYDIP